MPAPRWLPRDLAVLGPVTVATVVQNLGNLVVHTISARALGPGSYAVVGVVLAIGAMLTIPLAAVQSAVTRAVAEAGRDCGARPVLRAVGVLAMAAAAVAVLLSVLLAGPLRLSLGLLLAVLPVWVAASVLGAALRGIAIGRERVRRVAGSLVVLTVVRLAVLAATVHWLGAAGPLLATVLAEVASVLLLAGTVPIARPAGIAAFPLRDLGTVAWVTAGLWAFTSGDALLAKLWLSDVDAGLYVAASTMAKTVLAVPAMAIAVSLPRFALGNSAAAARAARNQALGRIGGLGVVGGALLFGAAGWLIPGLLGAQFAGAVEPTRVLAIGVAASVPVSLQTNYLIARRSARASLVWTGALTQVLAIGLWHPNPLAVALMSLAVVPITVATLYIGPEDRVPLPHDPAYRARHATRRHPRHRPAATGFAVRRGQPGRR